MSTIITTCPCIHLYKYSVYKYAYLTNSFIKTVTVWCSDSLHIRQSSMKIQTKDISNEIPIKNKKKTYFLLNIKDWTPRATSSLKVDFPKCDSKTLTDTLCTSCDVCAWWDIDEINLYNYLLFKDKWLMKVLTFNQRGSWWFCAKTLTPVLAF